MSKITLKAYQTGEETIIWSEVFVEIDGEEIYPGLKIEEKYSNFGNGGEEEFSFREPVSNELLDRLDMSEGELLDYCKEASDNGSWTNEPDKEEEEDEQNAE
jgi:hypothetical protein